MKLLLHNTKGERLKGKSNKYRKVTAITLSLVLILSLFAPVMAVALGPNTPKQEVVYINLHTDGSVDRIYVVNIFELSEDGQIIDYGDYTALRNMTTNDEIVFENETVTIDTTAGKLYYEGELSHATIPWRFTIRYYMDGMEYPAGELAGKSGELKITMAVRKNPDCNSTFFDSFALQASFSLDTNRFKNIAAADATIANVGSDKQISYTLLPGKETDITITASVTDFEMTGISINGLPLDMNIDVNSEDTSELDDELDELTDAVNELDDGANELLDGAVELRDGALELKDGVVELQDGVDELYDGVTDLQDGVGELYDGSADLNSGAQDLLDGAIDLRDGADDLQEGAGELWDGVNEAVDGVFEIFNGAGELSSGANDINSGAAELYDGLTALSGQSGALISGAYAVFERLTAQATEQLNANLEAAGMETVTLTPSNYADVISELLDMLSGGAYSEAEAVAALNIRIQVETAVAAQIENAVRSDDSAITQIDLAVESGYGAEIDNTAQSYVALELAKTAYPDSPEEWLQSTEGQTAVSDYLSSAEGRETLANARQSVKAQYVEAAILQQVAGQMSTPEIQAQIDIAVQEQLSDGDIQSQISDAVNDALGGNAAYQGIISLKNQLDDYNSFYTGLKQYVTGVDSAAAGAHDLCKGTAKFIEGADELRSGAQSLYDGLIKLQDGSADLLNGTITLCDGTLELYDGAVELKDGTIELLDGVIELKDGTIELYDGVIELKDGVIELLDGAIELYDGTIELYDGTIELTDGTFEFKDKTANLDQDLKDKINDAISEMLGKNVDLASFVSDRNTNIESVQFVIKTPAVEQSGETYIEPVVAQTLTWWQKLLRLFGWY